MRHRAVVLLISNNKLLLLFRRSKFLSLDNTLREYYVIPGGGVEENETYEQTAMREMHEETGLEVKNLEKVLEFENLGQYEVYFLCRDFSGNLQMSDYDKAKISSENYTELQWVDLDKIKDLDLKPERIKVWILENLAKK